MLYRMIVSQLLMLLYYSLQRNKNSTDELQRCIEKRLESLKDTVIGQLRNEVDKCIVSVLDYLSFVCITILSA